MQGNIGLYSYGAACLAYTLLGCAMLLIWRTRRLSLSAILSTAITAVWAGAIAIATLMPYPPVALLESVEVSRNAAWIFLLLSIYGTRLRSTNHVLGSRRWIPWFTVGLTLIVVVLFASPIYTQILNLPPAVVRSVVYAIWVTMSLVGLLILENIYRNSSQSERWWVKYLCLGVGFLFAYDFFMYAGALLLQQLDQTLWRARGLAVAMTAPLVALAAARSRDRRANTKLSRHVIFHTFTLLAAGVYLIFMAIVGYFVSYLGGTWSGVLQITFLSATGLFLLVMLLSSSFRARSRVWMSKNFFSYKYDYRLEWLEFTETLAEGSADTPKSIIEAMSKLANCRAGLLWANPEAEDANLVASWQVSAVEEQGDFSNFFDWLRETGWIVDVQEWREKPRMYSGLEMPKSLADAPGEWLVIPLMFSKRLEGLLVVQRREPSVRLNWEDRDLLKVAGRQAACHLVQYQASQSLVELRQFEAFNRLSAYVIHDLKNILAEQSLIVSNAERHRDNPAFFDDVIDTVSDSVDRMTRLMTQMYSGDRGGKPQLNEMGDLLSKVVARMGSAPTPMLELGSSEVWVDADREQLGTVFGHIIQNAKDATDKNGRVSVSLSRDGNLAVIEVTDDGIGMSQDFLRERLFKPFDSTKGLTGIGIGAFESREVLRGLRGNIEATSEEGVGSCFRIMLPCVEPRIINNSVEEVAVSG